MLFSTLFMKSGTYYQHQLTSFLLLVLAIMSFFLLIVIFGMIYVLSYKGLSRYMSHQKAGAEVLAFYFSTFALLLMSYPSIYLLYSSVHTNPQLTVKIVASQWYWSFEISEVTPDPVLMYMLPLDELSVGDYRFLEVENRLVIPTNMVVMFCVTSSDVIHSFSMPTLGMKVDATAGLLCVVFAHTLKVGVHYGQCSEICGANHAFMPFVLEVVPFQSYLYWAIMHMEG